MLVLVVCAPLLLELHQPPLDLKVLVRALEQVVLVAVEQTASPPSDLATPIAQATKIAFDVVVFFNHCAPAATTICCSRSSNSGRAPAV